MTTTASVGLKRLLILASKLGYQTRSFAEAAKKLGVEVVFGTDRCGQLEDPWADGAIALHFEKPEEAAAAILEALRNRRPSAILALGDRPTTTAALVARFLGLRGNPPEATENCRNKLRQREIFRDAGLPSPAFFAFGIHENLDDILPRAPFPCVLKPLSLAASQGVIRANSEQEFRMAVRRIADLLESPELQVLRESTLDRILVESYIPGREVAIEGLLSAGELRILAIFDKPDPLEGPFFEESIYVTPSRKPAGEQRALEDCCRQAVKALSLVHGPIHAEFRINERGVWPLEIAPLDANKEQLYRVCPPARNAVRATRQILASGRDRYARSRSPPAGASANGRA